jgi:hypothetical protein
MRISSLAATGLALALASGSAEAGFVMEIDDPNTAPEPDLRIEDNGPNDQSPDLGLIEFHGYVSSYGGGATAFSKDFEGELPPLGPGFPTAPDLLVDISLFRSVAGDSLEIRVTDTGFDSSLPTGEGFVDVAIIGEGADGIQFDFFGDSDDQEFGRSFDIGMSDFFEAPIDDDLTTMGPEPADPVGSLTMSASAFGSGVGSISFVYVTALKLSGEPELAQTATPTAEPTATPTPTPTATPAPENECQCVPHRVVPSGNLAVLKKTTHPGGRGPTLKKKVGVVLKARERTRDACRPGSSTDTFSLRLHMVDDSGEVILDETRTGLTCDRRIRQQKFMATYEVENCAESEPSGRSSRSKANKSSKSKVTVIATTEDGELIATRTLKCNK